MKNILVIGALKIFSFATNAQRVDTSKVKVDDHEMLLYASGEGRPTINNYC